MPRNLAKLIFSVILCEGAGILGSFFTIRSISTWYVTLNKPVFSPPNSIFGPVWIILYLLMGISLYLVWSRKKVPNIFWIQLILNAIWTPVFFGLQSPPLGFVVITFLLLSIIFTLREFLKINKWSGYLLVPYLAWVSFAAILNLSIWILNF